MNLLDALLAHTERVGDCLVWKGRTTREGYGTLSFAGTSVYAHRAACELAHGRIPESYQVDHLCRVRACINPDHLEAVTQAENVRRQPNVGRPECIHGHPFDDENTYHYRGRRMCRTCMAEREKRRSRRKPGAGVPNKDKTHCKNGHPLSGANVYVTNGRRFCRECNRLASARVRVRRLQQKEVA